MREINEIIIHCTATRPSWWADESVEAVLREITMWHVEDRGWSDIGYHAIIHRNGDIAYGRPVERTGAHCKGRNANSIGIALLGGFGGDADDKMSDNFTEEQERSLRGLISDFQLEFPTITMITGHNEYANKACPTFRVSDWV